jgi:hypothetical protein
VWANRRRRHDLLGAVWARNATGALETVSGLQEHHDDEADDTEQQTEEKPGRCLPL